MAQLGFSTHATDSKNDSKFIFGAPGVAEWKGAIAIDELIEDRIKINRRRRSISLRDKITISSPLFWTLHEQNNTFFGYSVTSAHFNGTNELLYAASAPRANNLFGEVIIFRMTNSTYTKFAKLYTFLGHEIGEYFGYAMVTDDFDNDGLSDIAISAPLHSSGGRVYVYLNRGDLQFEEQNQILRGDLKAGIQSQFGISMSKLGDINRDGYGGE